MTPQLSHPLLDNDLHLLTVPLDRLGMGDLSRVGGKAANLGELVRAGLPVPGGFCVTTDAFALFMAAAADGDALYAMLAALAPDDVAGVRRVGAEVRAHLGQVPIPPRVAQAITVAFEQSGATKSYAVRSSATAEDLPDASFAGQQDTFLHVRGSEALLEAVRDCWISLFTDRAILYRAQNHYPHHEVRLAVVVQEMVLPEVSGILFTANPVSGHRHHTVIDASYGLGEALVSGLVAADLYRVDKRSGALLELKIGDKQLAIVPQPEGGTRRITLDEAQRRHRVLDDRAVAELTALGARIEAHYGQPMDIEWCLAAGRFQIVQARPITSLYPLPAPGPAHADEPLHVYASFSHVQVMTDPIPPLGRSLWRLMIPFGRETQPLVENPYVTSAGGRLYVDLSLVLRNPRLRRLALAVLPKADALIARAIADVVESATFARGAASAEQANLTSVLRILVPVLWRALGRLWWRRPEGTAQAMLEWIDGYSEQVAMQLAQAAPGGARLRTAGHVLNRLIRDGLLEIANCVPAGLIANTLVRRLVQADETDEDLRALVRGLDGNITTAMDLAVGDLADQARKSPALEQALRDKASTDVLEQLDALDPSGEFRTAWQQFLLRFGMRGPSEIDISRPRFREAPEALLALIGSNLKHAERGAHRTHHQRLAMTSEAAAERLAQRARRLPGGVWRAMVTRRLLRVVRHVLPLREHPKYLLMRVFALIRNVVLEAGRLLVERGQIATVEDIWFLSLPEAVAACEQAPPYERWHDRIHARREAMARERRLKPPRVMTSEGEIPSVRHDGAGLPDGSLVGTPVSAGVVEGVAHVVLDPERDVLKPGEILVAPFTDPGWTPLFIHAAGLVMEVGGVMTHGSVVAREYGIPAVVGVVDATRTIKNGQRLRVHGDRGYVEVLEG